jgi:uncharacterized cupredoxin-like copper-binding protein
MDTRRAPLLLFVLSCVAPMAAAEQPAQVVHLELQDGTTRSDVAHMRIVLDHATVKPGRVTFEAVNESKTLTHEVIFAHDGGKLPFDEKKDRVIEHDVRRIGEISDLEPGHSGRVTLNLGPGTYVLFCNEPGHFHDGMIARIVVAS